MLEMRWGMSGLLGKPWFWVGCGLLVVAGGLVAYANHGGPGDAIDHMARDADTGGLVTVVETDGELNACRALKALGNIADPPAIKAILVAAKDPRAAVREQAVLSVARAAPRKHSETLAGALRHDPDPHVRAAAAKAVGDAWDYKCMPDLVEAMEEDSSRLVHAQAEKAAARICGIQPGYEVRDAAKRRQLAAKFYKSFWNVYGKTITRYHHDYNKRD